MYVWIFCSYAPFWDATQPLESMVLAKVWHWQRSEQTVLFREQANVFNHPGASKDEAIVAGEKALLCLYNCRSDEIRDSLPYTMLCQKVATGTTLVQPESLPPSSGVTGYHNLRVYFQIQQRKDVPLEPEDCGWMENCFQLQRTCHRHMNPS